jgi:hypothetical protein
MLRPPPTTASATAVLFLDAGELAQHLVPLAVADLGELPVHRGGLAFGGQIAAEAVA